MALVNEHFLKLRGSYLFSEIAKKVNAFRATHPKQNLISLGIGDVTRPLPPRNKAMTSSSKPSSKTTMPRTESA